MKRKVTKYLIFALVLSTVLTSMLIVNAKKPLRCEKTMDMYPGGPGEIAAAGPISGDIDGWFVVYNLDPLDERTTGQVTHYGQLFEIWSDHYADGTPTGTKFMSGSFKVDINNKKLKWVAQGVVEYVDSVYENGRYEGLEGCIWHAQGIIDPVTFQVIDDYFLMNGPR